jgi:hypothetical protein
LRAALARTSDANQARQTALRALATLTDTRI